MDLFETGVVTTKQLVRLTVHSGTVNVFLTLAESEALIKALGAANGQLRAIIARDGPVSEEAF